VALLSPQHRKSARSRCGRKQRHLDRPRRPDRGRVRQRICDFTARAATSGEISKVPAGQPPRRPMAITPAPRIPRRSRQWPQSSGHPVLRGRRGRGPGTYYRHPGGCKLDFPCDGLSGRGRAVGEFRAKIGGAGTNDADLKLGGASRRACTASRFAMSISRRPDS